jgi:hypothetical protein
MKKLIVVLFAVLMAGCASVVKVDGEQVVNGRLSVKLTDAWNKLSLPGGRQPYDTWTQEGLWVDQLRLWAGVRSGEALMQLPPGAAQAGQKAPRLPTFQAGMAADQLVSLFEVLYSNDGSQVTMTKIEAADFANQKGVRFEFTILRKRDGLPLHGKGWVAVRNNELFAATFVAPRLNFYPTLLPRAEQVIGTARIKG